MDEFTVDSAQVAEQAAPADVVQATEISAADILSGMQQTAAKSEQASTSEKQVEKPQVKEQPQFKDQGDINKAIGARVKAAEKKAEEAAARRYETSPEYLFGKSQLEEYMAKNGVSREAAVEQMKRERSEAAKKQYREDPASLVDALAGLLTGKKTPSEPEPELDEKPTLEQFAQKTAETLRKAKEDGVLPDDFKPTDITPTFLSRVQKYGSVEAAVEMWQIEKSQSTKAGEIAAKVDQRRREPKPISTTGEDAKSEPIDYSKLPPDQWRKLREEAYRKSRDGVKVRL